MTQKQAAGAANRKKAPNTTLYTSSEAIKKLNMPKSTFQYHVKTGKIKKITPPGMKEGYYPKKEIDELADAMQLFALQYASEPIEFANATEDDIEGIYNVITSLWGGSSSTPVELRKSWYKVNPLIDYVVKQQGIITGYLNISPYKAETLNLMMEGKKRGWDIKPEDIYTFMPGNSYDCFTGLAVRQDIPNRKIHGMRLILGFYHTLADLAHKGIIIRNLYATSDQPDGIKLCEDLGFTKQAPAEGSTFNRYRLDLEKADSPFARRYRDVVKEAGGN